MASRGKRVRRGDGGSSSNQPASMADSPDSATPPVQSRSPWPRLEGGRIPPSRIWEESAKEVAESEECTYREISETWDEYDTLFYNAWLDVVIQPTRLADGCAVRRMRIKDDVTRIIQRIGLGTIATTGYDLFPDLVRQFLSTARVYYRDEIARVAQEGTLTFLVRGVRYRISIPELCGLYGFDPLRRGIALPIQFADANNFWSQFGTGRYDSRASTQTDIRHPVLRYVARIISHTVLCKMEPGKMRLAELILLYYGVGDLIREEDLEWYPIVEDINYGALFAHHLVSLKTKPFLGTGTKKESVGSLLTPIFHYCGIDTSICSIVTTRPTMDARYLKNARWMKTDWVWCFRSSSGAHTIQLPQPELTEITDDPRSLLFEPGSRDLRAAPPVRLRRGASSTAPPSVSEDAPASDLAGGQHQQSHHSEYPPFEPLVAPEIPMETAVFQRFVVDSLQRIWATIARNACVSRHRHRSITPPQPGRTARPLPDSSSDED